MSKARIYRDAMLAHHGRPGHITMMCHTFVTEQPDLIKTLVAPAMAEYIRVNMDMQREHAVGLGGGGFSPQGFFNGTSASENKRF